MENTNNNKGFVTNHTARNNSRFAAIYLNNQSYTVEKIRFIKNQVNSSNLDLTKFDENEFEKAFRGQNTYLKRILIHMNENRNFLDMVEEIDKNEKFLEHFKRYETIDDIITKYERRIFHTSLGCEFMRKDFDERKNSGVFIEDLFKTSPNYYEVEESYLSAIGMTKCKACAKLQ